MSSEELVIFARFHAREGQETAVAVVLREQVAEVPAEPGCLAIAVYRSIRDPRLFWIHSRWTDEAAFEIHAELPRTVRFIERIEPLIDHPLDVTRAHLLSQVR
jgi:quinol monooxygenase YgiN